MVKIGGNATDIESMGKINGNGEMHMRKWNRVLACILTLAMVCVGIPDLHVKAATVKLNKSKLVLYVGKTAKLKVMHYTKKVNWSTSKKSIVSVSRTGKLTAKVKAKHAGTVKVYAKCGKKRLVCNITVKSARINMEPQEDIVVDTTTDKPKPTAAVLTAKNSSGKTKYLADQVIVYDEEWDAYHFQFSIKLSDKKTRAKYSGEVEFEIINDAEESLYHQKLTFEKTDFVVKASDQSGGYLCDVEIPRENISAGVSEEGVIYYSITLSDETWFRQHSLEIDTLPVYVEEPPQETVVPYSTKKPVISTPTIVPTEEPKEEWILITDEPEEPTFEPEVTPMITEPVEVTEKVTPTEEVEPKITVEPTEVVASEEPKETVEPSESVSPTETPVVSSTPEVTDTATPSVSPTASVKPTVSARPTCTPTVKPTASVRPTCTPTVIPTPSPTPEISRDEVLEDSMEKLEQYCIQQGVMDEQGNYCLDCKIGIWNAQITYLSVIDSIRYEISAPMWDYDDVVLILESRPFRSSKSSVICRCSSERLGVSGVGMSFLEDVSFQNGQILHYLQSGTVAEADLDAIGNIYLNEGCQVWGMMLQEIGLDLSMLGYDNIYLETVQPVMSRYPIEDSMETTGSSVLRWNDYLTGYGEYQEAFGYWVISYQDDTYEYRMLYRKAERSYSYQVISLTQKKEFRLEWATDDSYVDMFFGSDGTDVLQACKEKGSIRKEDTIRFLPFASMETIEKMRLQTEANQYLQAGYEGWEKLAQCAGLSLPQIGLDGLYQS